MQMTGEQRIAAPRHRVWEALNDPAVLAQCIPGCQSLDRDGDDRFVAVAEVRIGPIGARFRGNVQLSDIDAPNGCTITGSGQGGIAGSARGGARVRLSDAAGGGTVIAYEVEAEVGGRMAQLGGPIIDATARNLAGRFFQKFGDVVGGEAATATATVATEPAAAEPAASAALPVAGVALAGGQPAPLWGWVAALVVAVLTGFTFGARHAHGEMLVAVVLLIVTAAAAYEAGRRGARR